MVFHLQSSLLHCRKVCSFRERKRLNFAQSCRKTGARVDVLKETTSLKENVEKNPGEFNRPPRISSIDMKRKTAPGIT